jgi:hypothetical protein
VKGLSKGVELIHFDKDPSDSEWYVAQLACDNTLGIAFSILTPSVYDLLRRGEQALGEYLERQAREMISRYGDARNPRPDPVLTGEARV